MLFVACLLAGIALTSASTVQLIVDTDLGSDVDDVGALAVAHLLHKKGEVALIAIVHNTGCKIGIGGVSAIGHFYGQDDIPLGAYKGPFGSDCSNQDQYLSKVIKSAGGPVKSSDDDTVKPATDTYRQALARAPDNSVNIACVGMPMNLRDLLKTKPDQYSSMSGYDLIAKKVNTIVFTDSEHNFGCAAGKFGPISSDCAGSASGAMNMPPNVRLVFNSKGLEVYTGAGLQSHPQDSPCREAYGESRQFSQDPITVLVAAKGANALDMKEVNIGNIVTVGENGKTTFSGSGTNNAQTDYNSVDSAQKITDLIDSYLNQVPAPRARGQLPPACLKCLDSKCPKMGDYSTCTACINAHPGACKATCTYPVGNVVTSFCSHKLRLV